MRCIESKPTNRGSASMGACSTSSISRWGPRRPGTKASPAIPLLPILREDHDPGKPLELRIDLTGAKQGDKQTGKGEPYKKGKYYRVVDTFYDDPWYPRGSLLGLRAGAYRTQFFTGGLYSAYRTAYRDVVGRVDGRPVLACFVHFLVGGGLVELAFEEPSAGA